MPTTKTVVRWVMQHKEFREMFTVALQCRAEMWGESLIEEVEKIALTNEDIQKGKLLIDTKKWIMGRLCKMYSDKVTLAGDKDNPIQLNLASALDTAISSYTASLLAIENKPALDLPFVYIPEESRVVSEPSTCETENEKP